MSHALNTSAFGVARLKAHFGESLRPYDLVWPHGSTHENEAIQPSYILCNQARRSEVKTPDGTCIYRPKPACKARSDPIGPSRT